MIAIDTNLMVYAHRRDSAWFEAASATVRDLAEGKRAWAIPWPCVHEFLAVVTHPRIYDPPTPMNEASEQIAAWLESPRLSLLAEGEGYSALLQSVLTRGQVVGPQVHDGRIVALCTHHGVTELWTADRDFSRFPGLTIVNPLVITAH